MPADENAAYKVKLKRLHKPFYNFIEGALLDESIHIISGTGKD